MSNLVMVDVVCANRLCPEAVRMGKAKVIGACDVNAQGVDMWCGRCRAVTFWRKRDVARPLRVGETPATV